MPLEWVDEGDAAWERLWARLDGPTRRRSGSAVGVRLAVVVVRLVEPGFLGVAGDREAGGDQESDDAERGEGQADDSPRGFHLGARRVPVRLLSFVLAGRECGPAAEPYARRELDRLTRVHQVAGVDHRHVAVAPGIAPRPFGPD